MRLRHGAIWAGNAGLIRAVFPGSQPVPSPAMACGSSHHWSNFNMRFE